MDVDDRRQAADGIYACSNYLSPGMRMGMRYFHRKGRLSWPHLVEEGEVRAVGGLCLQSAEAFGDPREGSQVEVDLEGVVLG